MTRTPLGLAALLLVACKPKVVDLPICPEMVAAGKADEAEARTLPIDVWYAVLVKGFNRTAMDAGEEPRECSNQPVNVEWPQEMATDPRASARKLPREPRTDADISFSDVSDGEVLVWARIDSLENGDGLGPVGLARWIARGLEIRGIGSLQAPAQRVRMRLEAYGDIRMLVVESEACPKDQPEAAACPREVQVLPLENQRFVSAHMVENGVDKGPARFLLIDSREETLKDGWTRKYALQRRLEFDGVSAVVHENITTKDCDPKNPSATCEEHVAAQEKRVLEFRDGALHTTPSAWDRVGKTSVEIPAGE
ncbi:MAG: hypothetical protein JNL82_28165 [Myxococcales bacterium]|nr:hypothetical protein [Myxococcales bacterium]